MVMQESRQKRGRLLVRFRDAKGNRVGGKKIFIATAHRPGSQRQKRIVTEDPYLQVELPAGDYSYQAWAENYGVARGAVSIHPEEPVDLSLSLHPAEKPTRPESLKDRLARYGLEADKLNLRSLNVAADEKKRLYYKKHEESRDFTVLRTSKVADLKRWLGTPDASFGHDMPVFGRLPKIPKAVLDADPSSRPLSVAERTDLARVADEYIYGNSAAVQEFESLIDKYLQDMEVALFPVFHYDQITIGNGAVLEVGNGSSSLVANVVRIHANGTLRIVGPCRIDVGRFEEFT